MSVCGYRNLGGNEWIWKELPKDRGLLICMAAEYAALSRKIVWVVLYLKMLPNGLWEERRFQYIQNYKHKQSLEMS